MTTANLGIILQSGYLYKNSDVIDASVSMHHIEWMTCGKERLLLVIRVMKAGLLLTSDRGDKLF